MALLSAPCGPLPIGLSRCTTLSFNSVLAGHRRGAGRSGCHALGRTNQTRKALQTLMGSPSGQFGRIPVLNSLLVPPHGRCPLCEMLLVLCPLASSLEVLSGCFNATLRAEAYTAPKLFSATTADSVRLRQFDWQQRWTSFRFPAVLLRQSRGWNQGAGGFRSGCGGPKGACHVFSPRRNELTPDGRGLGQFGGKPSQETVITVTFLEEVQSVGTVLAL
jgi:hypothetical protein